MVSSIVSSGFIPSSMFTSHQSKVFDTDVTIGILDARSSGQKIFRQIENDAKRFEQKFSRFVPTSELNQINQKKNLRMKVGPETLALLRSAKKFFRQTEGLFDPTIVVALTELGYNKTFRELQNQPASRARIKANFKKRIPFTALKINATDCTVTAPLGLELDLGGIAKGYWVDQAAQFLNQVSRNFWISAGGDMYLRGHGEGGVNFEVGIENPLKPGVNILKLNLPTRGLGIATSGIVKRRGVSGEIFWHHIIDPRSGLSVENSILTVTVIASSTVAADIMAKTILILGIRRGLAKINSMRNCACVIIDRKLRMHISKGLKKFL